MVKVRYRAPPAGFEGPAWYDVDQAAQREAWSPTLRAALDQGEIVITSGGWEMRTAHGLVPWCWWGVVTDVNGPAISGLTLNGRDDNALHHIAPSWALRAGTVRLSAEAADRAMARRAAARIRGTALFQKQSSVWENVYGVAAMDAWIEYMSRVPFCPACKDKSASCAHSIAITTSEGAKVAAAYLRRRLPAHSPEAQKDLATAASRYDRIVALLEGALSNRPGERYADFIGDLSRQQAHIQTVLRPIRDELHLAADALERAADAMDPN